VLVLTAMTASAQPPKRSVWDGVYLAEQAARGERTYREACGYCHRDNLQGDEGPALTGRRFTFQWLDRSVGDLLRTIESTMPDDNPGSLTRQSYVDVIAFLLKANAYPAGSGALPAADADLAAIMFTAKGSPARD
jgi:cytochrome c